MSDAWDIRVERDEMGNMDDPPKRIFLGNRIVEVIKVIDRWLAADHAYYKVRGADEATYILREDATGHWQLVMVDRLPTSL
jgi:hypothetical protein